MLTGGAGLRAMTRAFEEVFGIPDGMGGVPMAGRTDAWIFSQVAQRHGVPSDTATRRRFHDAYVEHLAREVHLPGPRKGMMPGVGPLLDALAPRDDVYLALLTGNFERGRPHQARILRSVALLRVRRVWRSPVERNAPPADRA